MDVIQAIRRYSFQPIPHHVLSGLLKEYANPNNKINQLVKQGILTPVVKGLYVTGPALDMELPDNFLLANLIFGPSYVSLESALSYYDLIPERVYAVTSVTTKLGRAYQTPIAAFQYVRLPLPYYSYGIRSVRLTAEQTVLMASPEKALFDKIVTTPGVDFRSKESVRSYLEDDLRLDADRVKSFDQPAMQSWLSRAPKKRSLSFLLKTIPEL